MVVCPQCQSSTIETDHAAGNSYCATCGTVLEEDNIVNEITFGETSSGAAIVQGSFLSEGATGARISGPFRNQSSENSREQTLRKGRQRINALAHAMKLPERFAEAGARYFSLAVSNGFIQGRRSQYVVASCLYVVCRMERTAHMLIDFSDILQINVFVLGSTFLQFTKALHIRNLPWTDPSLYIQRFAMLLEFGADTNKVAADATRLVGRMKDDWLDVGRRPAGLCGACLFIAARMNNYRRSVEEIVHVVKVAEITVQTRLSEFAATPAGNMSVDEFRGVRLDSLTQRQDPPSFNRARRDKRLRRRPSMSADQPPRLGENGASESSIDDSRSNAAIPPRLEESPEDAAVRTLAGMRDAIDPALCDEAEVATEDDADQADDPHVEGEIHRAVEALLASERLQAAETDFLSNTSHTPAVQLRAQRSGVSSQDLPRVPAKGIMKPKTVSRQARRPTHPPSTPSPLSLRPRTVHRSAAGEDNDQNEDGEDDDNSEAEEIDPEDRINPDRRGEDQVTAKQSKRVRLSDDVTTHERDAEAQSDSDNDSVRLSDVDDWEIEAAILSPEQVAIKTQVWTELNRDYLLDQRRKILKLERDRLMGVHSSGSGNSSKRVRRKNASHSAHARRAVAGASGGSSGSGADGGALGTVKSSPGGGDIEGLDSAPASPYERALDFASSRSSATFTKKINADALRDLLGG
ncbi:transcription factor TFIIIB subunit brf1 [Savitreella phatthalungensis]